MQRARRSRERRLARGAVMVEAVIVTGMIVTVLICGIALFRVYASKINVTRDARFATWKPALDGCGSGADMGSIASAAQLPAGDEPPMPSDAIGNWLALSDNSQGKNEAVPIFGRVQDVSSQRSVVCNERPAGGDPGSQLGGLSDVLLRE